MNPEEKRRHAMATELACGWHADQRRKGTDAPYVSHLLQVSGLILEHGGSSDQAIAGLLHDCLEDAPNPAERVHREGVIEVSFGEAVARMVLDCTDTAADDSIEEKGPWRERKERYLGQLAAASPESLLVAACDKRHNLHSMVWDIRTDGASVLERFSGKPDQQIWYFESVLGLVRDAIPSRLLAEIEDLLEDFRELVTSVGA